MTISPDLVAPLILGIAMLLYVLGRSWFMASHVAHRAMLSEHVWVALQKDNGGLRRAVAEALVYHLRPSRLARGRYAGDVAERIVLDVADVSLEDRLAAQGAVPHPLSDQTLARELDDLNVSHTYQIARTRWPRAVKVEAVLAGMTAAEVAEYNRRRCVPDIEGLRTVVALTGGVD